MAELYEKYLEKRKFDKTPEPIPKDDETTLLSYAIPKAEMPELNEKLLAIQTEEHPISYIHFKGRIPEGYGAGNVKIYDKGNYKLLSVSDEKIVVYLKGEKVEGKFAIIFLKNDNYLIMRVK